MKLTQSLLAGRRALDRIEQVEIVEDWTEIDRRWALALRIRLDVQSEFIPSLTDWYLLADSDYPQGNIIFVPAKDSGIVHTFQHQRFNANGIETLPWRTGNICLRPNEFRALLAPTEPTTARERIEWVVRRAIAWLYDAANGTLTSPGQPFELPEFPAGAPDILGFGEDSQSFAFWSTNTIRYGKADLVRAKMNDRIRFLCDVSTFNDQQVLDYSWGNFVSGAHESACWVRLSTIPILLPWASIQSYGELVSACGNDGIDLYKVLRAHFMRMESTGPFLCLVGFPIPERVGGPACQLHWQAFQIPELRRNLNGFRNDIEKVWQAHVHTSISPTRSINWINSQNMSRSQLKSRGSLAQELQDAKILLVGAGAIGGVIGELLVRGGVTRITVVDNDKLVVGNLSRHVLDMTDVTINKAAMLAHRLRCLNPHVQSSCVSSRFGANDDILAELNINQYDLIIDCSASDDVPHSLGRIEFENQLRFATFSISQHADKMFMFCCEANRFPTRDLYDLMEPMIAVEIERLKTEPLPREGIGCWDPVFPANYYDIVLLAGLAVRQLDLMWRSRWNTNLQVFSNTESGAHLFWYGGERPAHA